MPEAVQAATRYLFDVVGLDFLVIGHYDWNRRSARVIEKCGFQLVGTASRKTTFGKVENSLEYILRNPRA